ncbi:MAG: 50S ribosomal protein L6 [Candidatus Paceibacterota bacterium]|jgi:large subunit ribosomal protein L6
MSKIGKKPISIPKEVEIKTEGQIIEVKGPKGVLNLNLLPGIKTDMKDGVLTVSIINNEEQTRINWGTMRSLLANAIEGVEKGFSKILEIEGVGYKAVMDGDKLVLSVGFSHPVKMDPMEGVKISTEKNQIIITGINKEKVGEMAAKIRAIKKPEPYKGKGIRYQGEVIRRKAGKKAAATATTK